MKNKVIAAILAISPLGAFGVHYYYLGDKNKFGPRLLLGIFLNFVGAIAGLIDGIKLLSMDQEKFDKQYNGGQCSDVATLLQNIQVGGSDAPAKRELPDF